MDGDEEKEGDQDKRKDVEVIESPEIADAHEPRNGKRSFFIGVKFLFEGEDFLLSKTEVSATKFVGV